MKTRTLEEILDDIDDANTKNDASTLEKCAQELEEIGTAEAMARRAGALGWACFCRGNFADSLNFYLQAVKWYEDLDSPSGMAHSMISAGMAHTITGNYPSAMELYQRSLSIWEETGDDYGIAQVNANIGIVLKNTGDLNGALERYHRTLALYEELGDSGGTASVVCSIGNVHLITGNYSEALSCYERSLQLYEQLGNKRYVSANCANIGHVYDSTGNYPQALEYYHRALAINEDLGDRNGVANTVSDLGLLYSSIGNHDVALDHYQRALLIYTEIGNRLGIAASTGAAGGAYFDRQDYSSALDHLRRALDIHSELGATEGVISNTSSITTTLIAMGSFQEAEEMLAVLNDMVIDDPRARIEVERSRASISVHHGDLDSAMQRLQSALATAEQFSLAPEQIALHRQLRDLCQVRMDFPGYIEHNNEFTLISEEINGKDTATKLAMQEAERRIATERQEHQKHLAILHSTLPKHIADRVARGEQVNDHYDNAAVIFLDIVGFTTLSDQLSSEQVVQLLDKVFTTLDSVCKKHDVVKIKTIGDSYMAVAFPLESSNSEQRVASPEVRAAGAALDMLHAMSHILPDLPEGLREDLPEGIMVRIGMHCGPITAGIIGTERMQYDVWGDTVNVASRMESSGAAGRIHVSSNFALALKTSPPSPLSSMRGVTSSLFPVPCSLTERGSLEIKGKGAMTTFWLSEL